MGRIVRRVLKRSKEAEYFVKGFAHKYRIEALNAISKNPNISINELLRKVNTNYKTLNFHLLKLEQSQLVATNYEHGVVGYRVTQLGAKALRFLGGCGYGT